MLSKPSHGLLYLLLLAGLLASFLSPVRASSVLTYAPGDAVDDIRTSFNTEISRLVIESGTRMNYTYFTLKAPHRLVIDMAGITAFNGTPLIDKSSPLIQDIRTSPRPDGKYRIVVDTRTEITIQEHFQLLPSGGQGFRVVFDLIPSGTTQLALLHGETQGAEGKEGALGASSRRDLVVVVDAGHGGKDPGAIGVAGTREKDVVLAISHHLHRLLNETPGLTAKLTRQDDRFLALRERTQVARRHHADFFVSIHADAFHQPDPQGPSVYALSERGASSETARWLAQEENVQPLVGKDALDLSTRDDMLASVLLDLTMTGTMTSSVRAGTSILTALSEVAVPHKPTVEQAAFMVLRSPDIPSLLVEAGFLTNPEEERKLRDPRYQQAIAQAIHAGLVAYYREHAPPYSRF